MGNLDRRELSLGSLARPPGGTEMRLDELAHLATPDPPPSTNAWCILLSFAQVGDKQSDPTGVGDLAHFSTTRGYRNEIGRGFEAFRLAQATLKLSLRLQMPGVFFSLLGGR